MDDEQLNLTYHMISVLESYCGSDKCYKCPLAVMDRDNEFDTCGFIVALKCLIKADKKYQESFH